MTLEEFIERLRQYEQQPKRWVVNQEAKERFVAAYKAIKRAVLKEEPDAKVSCHIDDGDGIITIDASWITVREVKDFCLSLSKANNFEIYPKLNETLQMNILFHGVYKPIFLKGNEN